MKRANLGWIGGTGGSVRAAGLSSKALRVAFNEGRWS